MGHHVNKCPLNMQQKDTMAQEKLNLANSREIILNNTSSDDDVQVNMAQISNVGRKSKHEHNQIR